MLYHRLFTSLLQPEPPPDTSPSSPPVHLGNPRALVPTGPFLWSKLYSKFNLDSTASLPEAFLSTIKPVIEGSELEELVGEAKTLAEFVFALGKVGELLRSGGQQEEILEKELEISYVLRQEDARGNDWKGRRSAKKKGGQQSNKNAEESLDRDERADLEAAIALSLQDQTTQGQPDRTFDNKFVPTVEVKPKLISIAQDSLEPDDSDSQLPFLANPSLPLPFTLPPPLSQSSAHDEDDLAAPFSLPTNSQSNGRDEETTPAVAFDQSRRGRYNLRPRNLNTTTPTTALVSTEPGSSSNVRKRSRSPSPAASPTTSPPSRRSSTTSPPTLIGVTRFPLSLSLLSSHLARSLSYWNGERQPEGVSIENVKRCRTCEFEEGCEWRAGKAKEMEQAARERKRAREASGGSRGKAPSGDLGRRSSDG
jgi:exonuclease V